VADAGHAPFWDQPETFNQLLADFAAEAAAERRQRQAS
jgi:pimeloyl-ACP methyl ester carboxylesterase